MYPEHIKEVVFSINKLECIIQFEETKNTCRITKAIVNNEVIPINYFLKSIWLDSIESLINHCKMIDKRKHNELFKKLDI